MGIIMMRRADREVTKLEDKRDILASCQVLYLSAQDSQGLFVFPVNFGYELEGERLTLYFHSTPHGRKGAAFTQACPAAFAMDGDRRPKTSDTACTHSFFFRSIMGTGTVRTLTDPAQKVRGLNAIMRQLTGKEWEFPDDKVNSTAVFALTVDEWSAKSKL